MVSIMKMDFELLEEIIEDLDTDESRLIKRYLLEGKMYKEIADEENKSYDAIKKRMEKIRGKIHDEMIECLKMNCWREKRYESG